LRSCCGTTNVLQLKPLWAMGKQSRGMGLGRRITMELPQLWVLVITAKEDGMSESLTSGDMSVSRKLECQATAMVEVRALGIWNCPEQRGLGCLLHQNLLSNSHPCACSPARPPTLEYFAHNLSIQLPSYQPSTYRRLPRSTTPSYSCPILLLPTCTLSSWAICGIYPLAKYLMRPENTTTALFGNSQKCFSMRDFEEANKPRPFSAIYIVQGSPD
jgi:hypothetical protein